MEINTMEKPGKSLLLVLLLALGLGAVGALLVLDKAVFLDPLPFKAPDGLVYLQGTFEQKGEVEDWGISHIDFLDYRQQNKSFETMAAFSPGEMAFNLVAGKEAERLSGELVSYTYFPLLGVKPALGRFFTAEEDGKPFTHPVAVLSYDLWQRRFDGDKGDKGIVGRAIDLNGEAYTVVGVAPAGFHGLSDKADAWIPSSMPPGPTFVANRRMRWLAGMARLKPGVTLEQARQDMNGITGALARKYPDMNRGMGVRLNPFQDFWFTQDLRRGLRLLTLGAALALLLACFNAAALARPDGLGLRRGVLLALGAGVLGLLLAAWALHALLPLSGITFPSFLHLTVGPAVILAVLVLAALCGLVISRLGTARPDGTDGTAWRFGHKLAIVTQVVLALGLAVIVFFLAKDYRQAVRQDLGFQPQDLLTVRVDLQGPKYETDPQVIEVIRRYLDRVPKVPGVASLAMGGPAIPTDAWVGGYITIEGHPSETPDGMYPIMTHGVSPEYFQVLGVPIVAGRVFTAAEAGPPGTPYNVVVSKAMAEKHWPGESPLGKHLKFGARNNPAHPMLTVIGVAADVQHQGLLAEERPAPDLYLPILQSPVRLPTTLNFLIRPQKGVAPASLVPAVERELLAVAPDSPPYDAATMEERLHRQTQGSRFRLLLASLGAGLAILFAATSVRSWRAVRPEPIRERKIA
jgi:hypothetical protein